MYNYLFWTIIISAAVVVFLVINVISSKIDEIKDTVENLEQEIYDMRSTLDDTQMQVDEIHGTFNTNDYSEDFDDSLLATKRE